MSDSYRLELDRVGMKWKKSNKNKRINGLLRVYHNEKLVGTFSTMERAINFVHFKVGAYKMKHSFKGNPKQVEGRYKVKCLRPIEPKYKTILIHDAVSHNPKSLSGCNAPFFFGSEANDRSSAEAMESLWTMLGGFKIGKGLIEDTGEITLVVLTNAIEGDTRTKETWEWDSRKK